MINDVFGTQVPDPEFRLFLSPLNFFEPLDASAVSTDSPLWQEVQRINPDWEAEALESDSYVLMYHANGQSVGVSCTRGVCHDFTPIVNLDASGGHITSP